MKRKAAVRRTPVKDLAPYRGCLVGQYVKNRFQSGYLTCAGWMIAFPPKSNCCLPLEIRIAMWPGVSPNAGRTSIPVASSSPPSTKRSRPAEARGATLFRIQESITGSNSPSLSKDFDSSLDWFSANVQKSYSRRDTTTSAFGKRRSPLGAVRPPMWSGCMCERMTWSICSGERPHADTASGKWPAWRRSPPDSERRHIAAFGELDLHRVVRALAQVVSFKFLAKLSCLNTNNRIVGRIEFLAAVKDLQSDRVFLQILLVVAQYLFHGVAKQFGNRCRRTKTRLCSIRSR